MDKQKKSWIIGVIGLGYVGLPLAMLFAEKNHKVLGIDLDKTKIEKLKQGKSYLSDVTDAQVRQLMSNGRFKVAIDYHQIPDLDVIVICVPTPLNDAGNPDLSYIQHAGQEIQRVGLNSQLVILESSTYPGTTEEVLLPILEGGARKVGRDFYLAYSPERINPGDKQSNLARMPKIVSGMTNQCLQKVTDLYSSVFERIVPVTSPRVAEMAKVMENSQRFINISFMNEMIKFCEEMRIDIWEVIEAINTKPYGNLFFYPGPGAGGHCIPVDPLYLEWKAQQVGVPSEFIQLSKRINDSMPMYIVNRLRNILPEPKRLQDKSILLLGVTYKKDINDLRESNALRIMSLLIEQGAEVFYHDPLVPELTLDGHKYRSVDLSAEILRFMDAAVILTDHSSTPLDLVISNARLVFDTRNATKRYGSLANVVRL